MSPHICATLLGMSPDMTAPPLQRFVQTVNVDTSSPSVIVTTGASRGPVVVFDSVVREDLKRNFPGHVERHVLAARRRAIAYLLES